jgi:hypothetical protein
MVIIARQDDDLAALDREAAATRNVTSSTGR